MFVKAVVMKTQSPTVKSLVLGTISCWLDDERRCCRDSVLAAHWRSLARFSGATSCRQWVRPVGIWCVQEQKANAGYMRENTP